MGYRKGYDCDICGYDSEEDIDFIGLKVNCPGDVEGMHPCAGDIHICFHCSEAIERKLKFDRDREESKQGEQP